MTKRCTLLIVTTLTALISQAETNRFITDNGLLTPSEIKAMPNSPESLSAKEFPEGNWGQPTEGFQLSLRFETNVFLIGQPIKGTLLLRNVSTNELVYSSGYGFDADFEYSVITDKNETLKDHVNRSYGSFIKTRLYQGRQNSFPVELQKRFSINSPGKYVIIAKRKVPCLDKKSFSEVTSAPVSIELISTNEINSGAVPTTSSSRKK